MARLILLGREGERAAGLLLEHGRVRLGFDGTPGCPPPEHVHAWLICDPFDPAQPGRRAFSHAAGMPDPAVSTYDHGDLRVEPLPLLGLAYGYRLSTGGRFAVWAPVATEVPAWARGADLMFGPGELRADAGARRYVAVPNPAETGRVYRL